MRQYFPFLDWVKNYKKEDFSGDLTAGLTVGIMLVPQGMAYAMLAGLSPIYGLYASTIPLIIYALFGTSRQLAVGPVAMVALLISSGVGQLAQTGSETFIAYAILLAFMVGVIQFAMGAFKLGFLVNFLSHPVIAGFTSAAAIIIGVSQFKHLFGLSISRGSVWHTLSEVGRQASDINMPTLLLGIGAIALLIGLKKVSKKIPGALVVVVAGMLIVYFGGLPEMGVKIVKDIPAGLPPFGIPALDLGAIQTLLPMAMTISFVGFMESIAVAKAIQAKHKNYEVVPNQELVGLGLANIAGSFFSAFPVTGGFSRTAVNDQAGAKSGLASIISAVLIIITLLFLTSYFYYLPNAILAAIIIVAVVGLIDIKEAKHLLKHDKKDFTIFMVTAAATLGLGIEEGILIGVVLSLGLLIYQVSYPHIAELGKVPESFVYRNVDRFDDLEIYKDILIIRFDAQLYFANTQALENFIKKRLASRPDIRHVIIEASAIAHLDSSAVHALHDLIHDLKLDDIDLYFTSVKGPLRDTFKRNGLLVNSNTEHFYLTTQDAVEAIHGIQSQEHEEYVMEAK
jgi:SulP family sulfate permease